MNFSDTNPENVIGNYVIQAKIGEGSYGTIHRCRSLTDNSTYVLKKIKMGIDGSGERCTSLSEAKLMQRIRHKNIVRFVDSFSEGDYLYLVMEYCDRGDLSNYLERLDSMNMPENRLWKFFI